MGNETMVQDLRVSCPFCREPVLAGAIKCKHCNSTLVPLVENVHPARFVADAPTIVLSSPQAAPDNGNKLGALYLSLAVVSLVMILSGSTDTDAQNIALGSLLFIGAPALVGSVYVLSSKTHGAVFSYFTFVCLGLSLLITLSFFP